MMGIRAVVFEGCSRRCSGESAVVFKAAWKNSINRRIVLSGSGKNQTVQCSESPKPHSMVLSSPCCSAF